MIKYLVIGDPVAHSRSPHMQNAAFSACGLGEPYGIRRVTAEELPGFFEYARKNLLGVNITIPHKTAAAQLADSLTTRAELCGSVNTLIIKDGHITGDSTDGVGLERALRSNFGIEVASKTILFLGAGGAARATSIHFAMQKCAKIIFANRTAANAQMLADEISALPGNTTECQVIPIADQKALRTALAEADILIQATSLGLKESDPPPFELELLKDCGKLYIFDTIYRRTPLLQYASMLGIPAVGGKEMLVHQGAASFEAWTGIKPPLEKMREGFELPPGGVEA